MTKQIKFVIIEQAEDNEAYITKCFSQDEVDNYESVGLGNLVVLSADAYYNLCMQGCGV